MGSTFQAPGTPTTNGGAQYASAGYWGENEKKQKEMLHLKEVMAAAMTMMKEERDKEKQGSKGEGKGDRVKLEEKYFRRMDLFEGDRTRFRNWIFDLGIAVGFVDRHLSEALNRMMTGLKDNQWIPEERLVPDDKEKSKEIMQGNFMGCHAQLQEERQRV